jgi:5-hydroxyisourate hydrolase
MSKITTHVLDAVLGRPAAGIFVRLRRFLGGWVGEGAERVVDGEWIEISSGVTDTDGRCRDLRPEAAAGTFQLTFETGAYFRQFGRNSIYSEIVISFQCDGVSDYHLPLLLSDNSYTTYRGS